MSLLINGYLEGENNAIPQIWETGLEE